MNQILCIILKFEEKQLKPGKQTNLKIFFSINVGTIEGIFFHTPSASVAPKTKKLDLIEIYVP